MYCRQEGHAEFGVLFGCIGVLATWDGLAVMLQRTPSFELPVYGCGSRGMQGLHLFKKDLVRSWPGVG